MKTLKLFCLCTIFLLVASSAVITQSAGDYRTVATGVWSSLSIWERFDGSNWSSALSTPTGVETITIQSADSVYFDVLVSISGTLINQGKLGGTGNLTIDDGGMYQHDQNNGSLPECTWAAGSTCKVTGYVTGSKPNNANQNFHHFIWECAGQTSNVDLAMVGNTIGGDFTVINTGSARVYLTSPGAYEYGNPITISGNVYVTGGAFASNGSSSLDTIEVITLGDIIVTGGNFSLSRGSGTDVYWTHYGNFSVDNATLQNSGGYTRMQKLTFAKSGTQTITLNNVLYGTGSSPFTMEVLNGTTLDLGTNIISSDNTGSFLLRAGGTLMSAAAGGIAENIQCTGGSSGGGNSFSEDANFIFNGSTAQVTSTLMPATVNNLTIDNSSGVTLSQPTTINGVLRLVAGEFNNTIPFTLGPEGSISEEGGTLTVPLGVEDDQMLIPQSFFVDQNYPNPFNPSTDIRFGLPVESYVTVKIYDVMGCEVSTLFEGQKNVGTHRIQFNASGMSSGVYFYRIQTDQNVEIRSMMLMK